jgi:hypothetical protein
MGFHLYDNYKFTSDGFHYYSALRNFANFFTFWAGPVFEYIVGNHGYFSFFIFAPLVFLYPSPKLLLLIGIFSHFLTAWLVMLTSNQLLKARNRSLISCLLGLLYIVFPPVSKSIVLLPYMFQPDFLFPPLLMSAFYCAIQKIKNNTHNNGFVIFSVLILLTKEEYLALFPFIFFVVLFALKSLNARAHKQSSEIINFFAVAKKLVDLKYVLIISIASLFSILTILYFRSLNNFNHAVRSMNIENFLSLNTLTESFANTFNVLLPILFLLFFIGYSRFKMLCLIFSVVFFRGILNFLIYGNVLGQTWANLLVAPLVFICLISPPFMGKSFKMEAIFTFLIVISIAWSVYISAIEKHVIYGWSYKFFEDKKFKNLNTKTIFADKKNQPYISPHDYFICDEFAMKDFMNISHVSVGWVLSKNETEKRALVVNSSFIVLKKSNKSLELLNNVDINLKVLQQDDYFVILKAIK